MSSTGRSSAQKPINRSFFPCFPIWWEKCKSMPHQWLTLISWSLSHFPTTGMNSQQHFSPTFFSPKKVGEKSQEEYIFSGKSGKSGKNIKNSEENAHTFSHRFPPNHDLQYSICAAITTEGSRVSIDHVAALLTWPAEPMARWHDNDGQTCVHADGFRSLAAEIGCKPVPLARSRPEPFGALPRTHFDPNANSQVSPAPVPIARR